MLKSKFFTANEVVFCEDKAVSWHVWELFKKEMTKGKKSKVVTRIEKVKKEGLLSELLDLYLNSVHNIWSHLFLSAWQYTQANNFKDNLEEGQMMCSHDFAKNITCFMQQEVQGAYYNHTLVTLHPSVAFHRCCAPGCDKIVRHEVIHLSSNLKHDHNAFKKFHCDTVRIVEGAMGHEVTCIVNVMDQAPSQYKNRNSFLFTSEYPKKLIHFFLGSRHGKSWSDQSSGRFLLWLHQAIACERAQIKCAKDIAVIAEKEYATQVVENDECQHYKVSINLVT